MLFSMKVPVMNKAANSFIRPSAYRFVFELVLGPQVVRARPRDVPEGISRKLFFGIPSEIFNKFEEFSQRDLKVSVLTSSQESREIFGLTNSCTLLL